jgi:tetratricopeptide (TPR) repeat protein
LWLRGQVRGLLSAGVFAALVNFALVSSFIWPDSVNATVRQVVWLIIAVSWPLAAWRTWRLLPQLSSPRTNLADQNLFLRAQEEYLKGHWVEAESLLERMLRHHPSDADVRLMLASLYRHTRRVDEAQRHLRLLERQNGGAKYYLEMAHERKLLARLAEEAKLDDDTLPDVVALPVPRQLAEAA